ncbi:MAG: hypothetical protein Q4C98_10775 [Capnocytophaga sp.]|nr:hypothetical protein [Capnocytophaga sp.]
MTNTFTKVRHKQNLEGVAIPAFWGGNKYEKMQLSKNQTLDTQREFV